METTNTLPQTRHSDSGETVDWKEIADAMERVRAKIGDLIDWIGDIGANDTLEISETDHGELGKIQYAMFEAHQLILAATPNTLCDAAGK